MTDTVVGRLKYLITGDTSFLDASLNKSSKSVQKFAGNVQSSGAMITKYFTGAALALAGKKLLSLSSDTEELGNKYNVVFKGIVKDTDQWVDSYTDAVNRGDTATKEYLASLQDIRTGYGDAIPTAAKFSEAVVGVTNDLSSFSNKGFEEASAAIQSGLSGQFEALRSLGVSLNVAIIDQGNYAASIGKTWQEMTNLEKQEAVLSGIMEQSKNAIGQSISDWRDYNYLLGDAAKTSESVANQEKGLAQTAADVGAEFGDTLIPAYSELLDIGGDLLDWADDMTPTMKGLTVAIIGMGAAFAAGGPIAVGVVALAGLGLKLRDARDRSDELAETTERLDQVTRDYQEIVSKLDGDISNLTESERENLQIKKEILAIQAQNALDAYILEQERYDAQQANQEKSKEYLEEELQAYMDVRDNREAAYAEFEQLNQKQMRLQAEGVNMAEEEHRRWLDLMGAVDSDRKVLFGDNKGVNKLLLEIQKLEGEINEGTEESLDLELKRNEAIETAAQLYADGFISIEKYKVSNKEIYEDIIAAAEGLNKVKEDAGSDNEGPDDVEAKAKAWQEYLQAILDAKEGETGAEAARNFIAQFDREIEADKTIYEALNGNLEDWDPSTLLQSKAAGIKDAISEMLSIDPEDIDEAFTTEDQSVQILLDALRETEAAMADLNQETNDAATIADEYREKLADLGRSEEEQIEHERSLAVARAVRASTDEDYNGNLQDDLRAINEFYDEQQRLLKEGSGWTWDEWADNALGAISDVAGAIGNLYDAIADQQIAALEAQMNAQLAAMGLLEEEEENRYTEDREQAEQELADLQSDLKKATDIEERNELEKEAAEKAAEVDELIRQEAQEAQKLAIEEKFEKKKAQLEYEAALQSWKLQKIAAVAGGAQAVVNALATVPYPANLAAAALATALTGLELTTIEISRPTPPSFAIGAWEIPEDMNANIHAGETILPRPFAEEFRENIRSGGGNGATILFEVYTTGDDSATVEESRTEDMTTYRIFTKSVVKEMFTKGEMNKIVTRQFTTGVRGKT